MKVIVFFLFLFVLAVYFNGVSPSVYGGDSGDVILAAWFGGVAHPPGYPLNTMIGWVFTHLPYHATVAFKANLMPAFLHAAVVSLFFLILQKVTKNVFVSIVAALILAFNPLFWLYAHIFEVFQLNLLLVSISVYFLILWRDSVLQKKELNKNLYLSFIFLGLAIFHHHTAVLVFPAFIYLIRVTKKKIFNLKNFVKLAIFLSLGFIPYIFIPFAALRNTPINWDNPTNITNFIRLITRADYGTFTAAGFIIGADLKQKFVQLVNLLLFLKADFGLIGFFLIIVGALYSFFKSKQLFWFVQVVFLFVGPFFLIYSSFPFPNSFYVGLWERYLIMSYFFVSIYLAFGVKFIFDLLKGVIDSKFMSMHLSRITTSLLTFSILLLFPAYLIRTNFFKTDLSNFHLGDWLGYDILASAENNSIVFVFGDTTAFNTQYIYYTTPNLRRIKLIKGGSLYAKEYREQIAKEFPDLKTPNNFSVSDKVDSSEFILALMQLNQPKTNIYSIDFIPQIDGFKWSSSGLLKKLVSSVDYDKNEVISRNEEIFSRYSYKDYSQNYGFDQYITSHIKEIYATSLLDLSDELIFNGRRSESLKYLKDATILAPEMPGPYLRQGNIYFLNKDCEQSRMSFEKVVELDKKNWRALDALSKVYGDCIGDLGNAEKYRVAAQQLKSKLENQPL